ncbi:MAG TPA: NUDIX domain-containing protein, partial [Flavisolibacter sp.]|nr:NUDIX domain-containing protein [Flavisolibacter sp.]
MHDLKKTMMTVKVKINQTKLLSKNKHELKSITYEMQTEQEQVVTKSTEIYNHGNAVTALLYNKEQRTIILTEQFRMATYINGNNTGILKEACAGLIDGEETPEQTVKREIKEELGYVIDKVQKVYEAYTSPGCLTEILTLYIAE